MAATRSVSSMKPAILAKGNASAVLCFIAKMVNMSRSIAPMAAMSRREPASMQGSSAQYRLVLPGKPAVKSPEIAFRAVPIRNAATRSHVRRHLSAKTGYASAAAISPNAATMFHAVHLLPAKTASASTTERPPNAATVMHPIVPAIPG